MGYYAIVIMLTIHCRCHAEIDHAWRMAAAVPDSDFVPIALHLNGQPHCHIVRINGDQTTTLPAALPV